MSFESSFCASPWFHMRITNSGDYEFCRWMAQDDAIPRYNIRDVTPAEFFQQHMASARQAMLEGYSLTGCENCYQMEHYQKVSGRQKQLLKAGVQTVNFTKTMLSSPWINEFAKSEITLMPQDWQIDLGNYCNSACVFCTPEFSSKVAAEWKKLNFIDELPPSSWCNDPALLAKFVDTLKQSPSLRYLHFIGGETLITPAFKTILEALIEANIHQHVTIGFTTNLWAWDQTVIDLLAQFKEVNLGMSIECIHPVNDYVRWPSKIDRVYNTMEQWISIGRQHNWLMQFRTTPTILTISNLLSVYDYAWQHGIAVESCNFLERPDFMRPSVLPLDLRYQIIDKMKEWLSAHPAEATQIVNTRDPAVVHTQIAQDLASYVNYLEHEPDESTKLPELAKYLRKLESNRKNSVVEYLPEYEDLLRSIGY